MDIGHMLHMWWAVIRHQRLIWWAALIQALLAGLVAGVSSLFQVSLFNDSVPSEFPLSSLGALFFILLMLVTIVAALILNTLIIQVTGRAYIRPEQPITWDEVASDLPRLSLRFLGAGLLWGLIFLGVFFTLCCTGLLAIGGTAALADLFQNTGDEFIALTGVTGILFFVGLLCLLVPVGFLVLPFVQGTQLASVLEEEQPWLTALQTGFEVVRGKYGWWLLVLILVIVVSVLANAVVALPLSIVRAFLISNQAMFFWEVALLSITNFVQAVWQSLVSLVVLTLFVILYMESRPRTEPVSTPETFAAGPLSSLSPELPAAEPEPGPKPPDTGGQA